MHKILATLLLALIFSAGAATAETATTEATGWATHAEVFDLSFPGGTPKDLVDALARASGNPVNVIIPNEGKDVQIPPFQLAAVSTTEVLSSLNTPFMPKKGGGSMTYRFERTEDSSIWTMKILLSGSIPDPRQVVKPVSIARYLDNYSIDDLSTAIHLAWEAAPEDSVKPSVKYHPETKLLIVSGSEGQIDLVMAVLGQLEGASPTKTAQEEAPAE